MNLIRIKCAFCGKCFSRTAGRINEARKFGWRQYCSIECQSRIRFRRIEKLCANPNCKNRVSRGLSQFKKSKSGRVFCSSLCAAIFNNPLRRKIKTCPVCGKQFSGQKIYCSSECHTSILRKSDSQKRREILKEIKAFYDKQGRIPVKKERPGLAWRAQKAFNSWNKAIQMAGFEPNPVIFSKKFIAKDGHKCDSFAEKIIDDWFYERKITHKKDIPYPQNRLLSTDFVVGKNLIEYFGLSGVLDEYDKLIREKRKLCKKYKLTLIEIFPKDLFPVNHLSEIIKTKKLEN